MLVLLVLVELGGRRVRRVSCGHRERRSGAAADAPSARPGDDLLDLLLSGADVPPLASGSGEAAAAAPPIPARAGVGPAVFPAPSPGASMAAMTQHPEMQYLNLIRDIMENGVVRGDRTGTGTVSKFGVQMQFSSAALSSRC